MHVIIKGNAIERHQMEKEVAKPAALSQLKTMTKQEYVKSTDPWYRTRVDTREAAKNYKVFNKNLERVIPETLPAATKDRMWRRAKALKDEFVVGMLSKEEMHPVKGFMQDGKMVWVVDEGKMAQLRTVDRNLAWTKKNELKVREYKNLMRHLCPEDSNAGDVEKFRPKLRGIH